MRPWSWRAVAGERATTSAGLSRSAVCAAVWLTSMSRLAERLTELLASAVRQIVPNPPTGSGRKSDDDAALVASARAEILADLPEASGLFTLAELLGVPPYRLSRAFPRTLGVSLTRYRNRVRVGRALDRLERGETSLATLACDLGFADQAHLTRTVREHLGDTPAALRHTLKSAG
jgi:transcriptional regulator GlxA family with amidase domain